AVGDQIIDIDGKKIKGPAMARNAIFGTIGTVVMIKVKSAATGEVFNVVVDGSPKTLLDRFTIST
ncbi:MAG: hypothetical protein MUQ10_01405, partial [Anaerolineae bacterium]|nr:hypothetical protein [Anaerolineae bacterium]